MGLPFLFNQL